MPTSRAPRATPATPTCCGRWSAAAPAACRAPPARPKTATTTTSAWAAPTRCGAPRGSAAPPATPPPRNWTSWSGLTCPRCLPILPRLPRRWRGPVVGSGCRRSCTPASAPSARPSRSWSASSSGCWTPTWPRSSPWASSSASEGSWSADGLERFCRTVRDGLATATFTQRRLLVELLIDRVVVTDGEVEIPYALPTAPEGPQPRFCQLRKDHLHLPAGRVPLHQLGWGGGKVGGDQGHVEAVGRVRCAHQHHLDRAGAEHRGPQAGKAGDRGQAALAVAGHLVQRERGGHQASQGAKLREPVAAGAGPATGAGTAWRCQPVQGGVGAQPAADGDLGGQVAELAAGVGAVADQVDAAGAEVAADHLDQLDGQVQPPRGVPWPPQPGQDGQADRPVRHKRQVDQHAQHDPVVAPGDGVAANPQRVVVPGGPCEDLAAGPPHEGVVDHQPDRRVGRDKDG